MLAESFSTYERFIERYETKILPWDDPLPPPEVIDWVPELTPGRALDLGCGHGRTARFLAQGGWRVDGIDFICSAVEESRRLARQTGVADLTTFHQASVTNLNFLRCGYDLAIDIGCMHSFDDAQLVKYRDELCRLLRPAASYILYAHFRDETAERPHGIAQHKLESLLAEDFILLYFVPGKSQVEGRPVMDSGWYWFQKR